jgi:hypothetical protein
MARRAAVGQWHGGPVSDGPNLKRAPAALWRGGIRGSEKIPQPRELNDMLA